VDQGRDVADQEGVAASRLRLRWELVGSGWAKCRIADGEQEATLIASYLTDALADLISGVGALYGTRNVERFFFDMEPQELRWVLTRHGADVDVAIYEFPDTGLGLSDAAGDLVWRSHQPRSSVAHAVLEAAQEILREHGEDGYHAKWVEHPYPVAAVQDLRRLHIEHDGCGSGHDLTNP
jgi:hypothetical protein